MNLRSLFLALTAILLPGTVAHADPLGTAFSYQGRLADGGAPASGIYDFRFAMDAPEENCASGEIRQT